jgi:hypothetical protein
VVVFTPESESVSVNSVKSVICARGTLVETYVRRSTLVFEIRVLRELGGQVRDDCGGSAYEVINFEFDTWRVRQRDLRASGFFSHHKD